MYATYILYIIYYVPFFNKPNLMDDLWIPYVRKHQESHTLLRIQMTPEWCTRHLTSFLTCTFNYILSYIYIYIFDYLCSICCGPNLLTLFDDSDLLFCRNELINYLEYLSFQIIQVSTLSSALDIVTSGLNLNGCWSFFTCVVWWSRTSTAAGRQLRRLYN